MSTPSGSGEAAPAPGTPAAPEGEEGRAIARHDLEAVIRRAVELSLAEREGEERLSEDEVVRVATEVGLPAKLARQALYEVPALAAPPGARASVFGSPIVTSSRAVPAADAERLRRRLEDYMSAHEYLQLVRRKGGRLHFVPAEDTLSSLARGLFRPKSRYQLARARRVVVDVRPLDEDAAHVQIATDFGDQRRSAVTGSVAGGSLLGIALGGAAAGLATLIDAPTAVTTTAAIGSFLGVGGLTLGGIVRLTARSFKRRMLEAKLELDGLLDRAEHGGRLEPPPPPWRRRLQQRLQGE